MNLPETSDKSVLTLTATIVAAYVGNHAVERAELAGLIRQVHMAITEIAHGDGPGRLSEDLKPAVPVKRSVTADYIVCLEDGKKFKSLKRHLRSQYDLTPEQYRERWGLPPEYPMVAPNYAAARSQLAKKMGLGTKRSR